jgi:hypothetical protein
VCSIRTHAVSRISQSDESLIRSVLEDASEEGEDSDLRKRYGNFIDALLLPVLSAKITTT